MTNGPGNRSSVPGPLLSFQDVEVSALSVSQSRISMSLPQQEGRTSPAFTWTVLLQVTQ